MEITKIWFKWYLFLPLSFIISDALSFLVFGKIFNASFRVTAIMAWLIWAGFITEWLFLRKKEKPSLPPMPQVGSTDSPFYQSSLN
jgi:hypothetical protein